MSEKDELIKSILKKIDDKPYETAISLLMQLDDLREKNQNLVIMLANERMLAKLPPLDSKPAGVM